jgi:hypothetical protein
MLEDQPWVKRISRNYIIMKNNSEAFFGFYAHSFGVASPSAYHYIFHDLYQYAPPTYKSRLMVANKIVSSSYVRNV